MGFLDNSGDIILDAVLTDAGRQRLARGDGSFRITQFALGDDEINYNLYNTNHPSGSAYYDIDIMQTPVFEAFTNNIASLNSKLISIARTDLFYLPVIKLNYKASPTANSKLVKDGYLLTADEKTSSQIISNNSEFKIDGEELTKNGILNGYNLVDGSKIILDQGIDNAAIPQVQNANSIPQDLKETQYFIEMDNRFMQLVSEVDLRPIELSYVDDDNMAAYYVSRGEDSSNGIVRDLNIARAGNGYQVLAGAHGTALWFRLKSKDELTVNDYLFDKLGTDITSKFSSKPSSVSKVKSINTSVRITGMTTGYSIDIPIVILKAI